MTCAFPAHFHRCDSDDNLSTPKGKGLPASLTGCDWVVVELAISYRLQYAPVTMLGDATDKAGGDDPVPREETKRDRFLRIAERRTQQVLEKIRVLGNCSNRSIYEFTDDEVERIFQAILRQVDFTRAQFQDRSKRAEFKL